MSRNQFSYTGSMPSLAYSQTEASGYTRQTPSLGYLQTQMQYPTQQIQYATPQMQYPTAIYTAPRLASATASAARGPFFGLLIAGSSQYRKGWTPESYATEKELRAAIQSWVNKTGFELGLNMQTAPIDSVIQAYIAVGAEYLQEVSEKRGESFLFDYTKHLQPTHFAIVEGGDVIYLLNYHRISEEEKLGLVHKTEPIKQKTPLNYTFPLVIFSVDGYGAEYVVTVARNLDELRSFVRTTESERNGDILESEGEWSIPERIPDVESADVKTLIAYIAQLAKSLMGLARDHEYLLTPIVIIQGGELIAPNKSAAGIQEYVTPKQQLHGQLEEAHQRATSAANATYSQTMRDAFPQFSLEQLQSMLR